MLPHESVARELGVEPDRGLTSEEAASRLARYGPNRFAEAKTQSRWHAFVRQYDDPMQIVLLVAGVISILEKQLAGQPAEIRDEIIAINTDARPLALQVALLVPILAGLLGLLNGLRMMRRPDPAPSDAAEMARG
jgi:magnesium-transporting ATPase (P-type)